MTVPILENEYGNIKLKSINKFDSMINLAHMAYLTASRNIIRPVSDIGE